MPTAPPSPAFWSGLALACALAGLAAWAAVGAVRQLLLRRAVLDAPNPRSSHGRPTPRGAGLALVPLVLAAWAGAGLAWGTTPGLWIVAAFGLALAAVSFADDLRGLPVAVRLSAHAAAVAAGLAVLPVEAVFQGLLPAWLAWPAAGLLWLWFTNLFNFMDGIDGISGIETVAVGAGLAGAAALAGHGPAAVAPGALAAAAALGFLAWNRPPARIFLGDAGSVPLGYLLGWLLLTAAAAGAWAPALVLPAYYLADASITVARRAARGERPWRAHREHFYQRAVRGGLSHGAVAARIALADAGLVALALLAAAGRPWPALVGAALVVALLLARLARAGRRARL